MESKDNRRTEIGRLPRDRKTVRTVETIETVEQEETTVKDVMLQYFHIFRRTPLIQAQERL